MWCRKDEPHWLILKNKKDSRMGVSHKMSSKIAFIRRISIFKYTSYQGQLQVVAARQEERGRGQRIR